MPDPIVVDASALLAVLLEEEGAEVLKGLLEDRPLLAPELIRYEAANSVLYAQRKRVIRPRKKSLKDLMGIIWNFPIQDIPMKVWWQEAVRLIGGHDLTFYDAAYTAAARSLKVPLLSLDGKILKVMKAEGIESAG
jgi:predicted nucleic acid-binding protein